MERQCRLMRQKSLKLSLLKLPQHKRSTFSDSASSHCEGTNIAFRLSSTRKKRAVPEDWATSDTMKAFKPTERSEAIYPGAKTLSADSSGDLVLTGSDTGVAGVYCISKNSIIQELQVGSGTVTDAAWASSRAVVSTSKGIVKVFENGSETASFSGHAGTVAALAVHPSGEILASVGIDRSIILYDLTSSTQATQIYTDSGRPNDFIP